MELYIPDIYKKTIYDINYQKLRERGITSLIFDLDNTIAPYNIKEPSWKMKKLFKELKDKGFKLIIMTNSFRNRVKPFKDGLDVDCQAFARKPKSKNYIKIMKFYKLEEPEIACIGDQIRTDIVGGNKMGLTTILVDPIRKGGLIVRVNSMREKTILKNLLKKDLFRRNKYYD